MKKLRFIALILSLTCLMSLMLTSCGLLWQEDAEKLLSYTLMDDGTYAVSKGDAGWFKEIVIPAEYNGIPVTAIADSGFTECFFLKEIFIPDSVTSIGSWAFSHCESLKSITIPDSITRIDSFAFSGCESLKSITIPDSVTSIGDAVFSGCSSLESIIVDKNNTKYRSNGNCLIETESKTLIAGCQNSVIPADGSVTSICLYAFSWCTSLTSITIPDSVTSIGDRAFEGCRSLTSVVIGDSVTSIGACAFRNCTSLESITIPDSVTTIVFRAFVGCRRLTSVVIGDGVTSIGDDAFYDCSSLETVYYTGSEEDWAKISISGDGNDDLTSANIIYNYNP